MDVKHHVYLLAYVPNKSTFSVDVKQHFNLMSALDKHVSRIEALQSLVVTTCGRTCFGLAACTQRDQQHGIYAGTCDVVFRRDQEEGGELYSHEELDYHLRVQARSRGERWCWTLKRAQERSRAHQSALVTS